MTRDDNRERIRSVGSTNRLKAPACAESFGKLLVADGCAVWDLIQFFPHAYLKWGSDEIERNREFRKLAVEVSTELVNNFLVPRFVVDHFVVVRIFMQPTEKILSVLLGYTNLANALLRRGDVDETDFRFK